MAPARRLPNQHRALKSAAEAVGRQHRRKDEHAEIERKDVNSTTTEQAIPSSSQNATVSRPFLLSCSETILVFVLSWSEGFDGKL